MLKRKIFKYNGRVDTVVGVAIAYRATLPKSRERSLIAEGTIVDATIITAPSSAKNKDKTRDLEMKPTKKGSNYYFGMKCHIGADAVSGFVHTIETTAANEADINVAYKLLHGEEEFMYAYAGYTGSEKRKKFSDRPELSPQIMKRRSSVKKLPDCQKTDEIRFHKKEKSRVRAKVEFPFHMLKNWFKFKKTVYKSIKKNTDRLYILFAFSNLYLCKLKGLSLVAQN